MHTKINIRESYRYYKKNVDSPVEVKVYVYIILGYIKFLVSKILKAHDVRLPAELGVFGVRGRKIKPKIDENGNIVGLAPDWGGTKALWARDESAKEKKTILFHFNDHTGGFRYKLIWFKRNVRFKNRSAYSFRLCRPNRRAISRLIKQGQEYLDNQ